MENEKFDSLYWFVVSSGVKWHEDILFEANKNRDNSKLFCSLLIFTSRILGLI